MDDEPFFWFTFHVGIAAVCGIFTSIIIILSHPAYWVSTLPAVWLFVRSSRAAIYDWSIL